MPSRLTSRAGTLLGALALVAVAASTAPAQGSLPTLSAADIRLPEGNTPGSTATFTVQLSATTTSDVTVSVATTAATAQAPGDYAARTETVTIPAGQTSATFVVDIVADDTDETDETFDIALSTPSANAGIGDPSATATLEDDDPPPKLSVGSTTVTEGTGATATATFAVTLSTASSFPVSVAFSTVNGSATAPSDYATKTGELVFAPGETRKAVEVLVAGDAVDEDPETFQLQLADPGNAMLLQAIGIATIIDDDPEPTVSISDVSALEGTGSNRPLVFTVKLSTISSKFVRVNLETIAGTATAAFTDAAGATVGDYTPSASPTLTFSPGLLEATVTASIRADSIDEADETLTVRLTSAESATIADGEGLGTILDDDGPSIAIADLTVPAEGAAGATTPALLTVTLSAASPQPVTVNVASANDTALAGQDYEAVATGAKLTILPGDTTATILTTVTGDALDENDEKYRVSLTVPVNATLGDGVGVVTVTDDDDSPSVRVDGVRVVEGTGGTSTAKLDVVLSAASGRTLLAGYATQDETAIAGQDYQQAAELLTFNPGETTKQIAIPIAPDADVEEDETFKAFVFNAAAGADGVTPVTVTIADDDLTDATRPVLSVDDVALASEGDAGTSGVMRFTVTMDRPLARRVTVDYAAVAGSASIPEDLLPASGTLSFAPGERTKAIDVTTVGDTLFEFNHDFRIELSNPVNAKLGDGSGLGIITDDDVGGGRLLIGTRTAPLPLEAVRLRDVLCVRGTAKRKARCTGIRVAWTVAAAGTIRTEVAALVPRRGRRAARQILLLRSDQRLKAPGSGTTRVKRPAGRTTERLVRRVRAGKVRELRVTLSFTNRFGGRQSTTEVLRLRP